MHDALQDPLLQPAESAAVFEVIADALAGDGWLVLPDALPAGLVAQLLVHARSLERYRKARVGRHADTQLNPFVRRDRIAWIDRSDDTAREWLDWAAGLSRHLNRTLMLGLVSFESHFAHFPPGTFYRRHLDAFRGESNRVVSVACYLNERWLPGDGGELVLYDGSGAELGRFPPIMGTLAVYLSEVFPHEVLPTATDRFSLAGWFRCRAELPLDNA